MLTETARRVPTHLITQGEFAVSADPDAIISTLLGSCVACCLWDDVAGCGGMNHLLLAGARLGGSDGYDMAGVADMEQLINGIIKLGAQRNRLKAKVFGGSNMLGTATGIGEKNASFAFDFLAQEGIECMNSSVGGLAARTVKFWPASGRVNMRLVADTKPDDIEVRTPARPAAGNDLELF